jgi:NAD(P)-dependent dehydrogenase (short-subunit alcohol dehydrogenase family)
MDTRPPVSMVFGGGSGLGQLAALRWAQNGGTAIALDIYADGLESSGRQHASIIPVQVDVRDSAAVNDAIRRVECEHGPISRIDNAAAIFPTSLALDTPPSTFEEVIRTNFLGMVHVSLAGLAAMKAHGRGVLVNYCSIAGIVPQMHMAAYSSSKAACIAFTQILFHENLRSGVHVVCVCPRTVDTPLLKQATSQPRILTVCRPAPPARVLDRLDRAIRRRQFLCLPDRRTRLMWRISRFTPSMLWRFNHLVERR